MEGEENPSFYVSLIALIFRVVEPNLILKIVQLELSDEKNIIERFSTAPGSVHDQFKCLRWALV